MLAVLGAIVLAGPLLYIYRISPPGALVAMPWAEEPQWRVAREHNARAAATQQRHVLVTVRGYNKNHMHTALSSG